MATDAATSVKVFSAAPPEPMPFAIRRAPMVLATMHVFPTMEPLRFEQFPSTFLYAPLRRDILHKAVVFEGDAHRLGRANAKTRGEVRGSSKKIRPQKGTGKARLGDKKSPMLRGGGVAHGPRPRDFSTDLPRKMYDMAWRTAISYRYRRGELIVVDNALELQEPDTMLAKTILKKYGWGNEGSRSLMITADRRLNLEDAMKELGSEGRVLTANEVDVKDMLEMGRVIIEKEALVWFEKEHGIQATA
ncbi:ribosomal protein L4 domain-containing protein [Trichophaea hybrida]|nr:ribosomal protein L4 domain-containing protein [Trichophaea hybrida]